MPPARPKVGIISAYMDTDRKGEPNRGFLQPQVGPLIASLLPPDTSIDVVFDTWRDPDWGREYSLLFISALHSDFDRARQISHYWRRRGAKTVFGGIFASTYPALCAPYFDAVVVGYAEGAVPEVYRDFCLGALQPLYVSGAYDPANLPVPRLDLVADQQGMPMSFEATRGCPFACDFCSLTAVGTRFHARPPELVVRDLREGRKMLTGRVAEYRLPGVLFVDNNIGGSPSYLAKLCEAITPLGIKWAASITFNCLLDDAIVKALARAGCRTLFTGLESFNPDALANMRKHQNVIDEIRTALDRCRRAGILVMAGLMVSPSADDWSYVRTIPTRLHDSGLHVPTFICIECPIPGTPYFQRLAASPSPKFLPNALLRDFNGYTLVAKPERESVAGFVEMYQWVLGRTYTKWARLRKLADDLPRLAASGVWESAMVDVVHQCVTGRDTPCAGRTFTAGDVAPPEDTTVPFSPADFDSEEQWRAVMQPWRVTDEEGRVLGAWRDPVRVFERNGRVTAQALELVGVRV